MQHAMALRLKELFYVFYSTGHAKPIIIATIFPNPPLGMRSVTYIVVTDFEHFFSGGIWSANLTVGAGVVTTMDACHEADLMGDENESGIF
jgi:hypothetical protein